MKIKRSIKHQVLSLSPLSLSLTLMLWSCFFFLLQAVRGMLENPNEPVSDLSYFDCIESVMENSKVKTLFATQTL